jgi:hypothetical protein
VTKAEVWAVGLINGILLTTDWCSWFKGPTPNGGDRRWSHEAGADLAGAVLYDGNRSMNVPVKGRRFQVPIGDNSWSNDAIVELAFAPPAEPVPATSTPAAQAAKETAP